MKAKIAFLKKYKTFFLLLPVLMQVSITAIAQKEKSNTLKKEGLSFYAAGNYPAADIYLSPWMKANPKTQDTGVLIPLADCFWKERKFKDAYDTYRHLESVSFYSMPAIMHMRLADLYSMDDKYMEAANQLTEIKELEPRKNKFSDIYSFIKDSSEWSLSYPKFNSIAGEYLPYIFQNNLYLTTDRGIVSYKMPSSVWPPYSKLEGINTSDMSSINIDSNYRMKHGYMEMFGNRNPNFNNSHNRLYKINFPATHEMGDSRLLNVTGNLIKVSQPPNIADTLGGLYVIKTTPSYINFLNKGSISFSVDANAKNYLAYFIGNTVSSDTLRFFFWKRTQKIKISPNALYRGKLQADSINNVQKMSIDDFSGDIIHATVSRDGNVLVFSGRQSAASDYDLYYAKRKNDTVWEKTARFGNNVNTIRNEVFPTLQKDGWLYFSSDGLPGLGALDIFKMPFYINNTIDATALPEHLSYPLNTAFDDYGVSIDTADENNIKGYLSTNRYGNDDIYGFSYHPILQAYCGKVYGKLQNGTVQLLPSTEVQLREIKNNVKNIIQTIYTDKNGSYCFDVKKGKLYEVSAQKDGWLSNEEAQSRFKADGVNKIINNLYLNQPKPVDTLIHVIAEPKGKSVKEFVVHHYFNRTEIINSDKPVIDSVVQWIKTHKDVSLAVLTSAADCYGSVKYNNKLSKKRAYHVKAVIKSHGVNPDILQTKFIGKNRLIEGVGCPENKTVIQQQPNRYTSIIINYNEKE